LPKNNPTNIESYHLEVKDRSFGFFIYFYDESQGHVLLYSFPSDLKKNESEKSILAIHPAWWHQEKFIKADKFSTMDLELNNVVYSATLFTCKAQRVKQRAGMDAEKWTQERFILIVKSPAEVSFIAQEILQEFYFRIKNEIGDHLCYLVKESLETKNQSYEVLNKSEGTKEVISRLDEICHLLTPKSPLTALKPLLKESKTRSAKEAETKTKSINSTSKKKMRFTISPKMEPSKKRKPIQKNLRIISMRKSENDFEISLKNESSVILRNVAIRIFESRGFFSKDKKIEKINKWSPGELISVIFTPKEDPGILYLLKISDDEEIIKVKRIEERLDLK
jgi:hypothetical protein